MCHQAEAGRGGALTTNPDAQPMTWGTSNKSGGGGGGMGVIEVHSLDASDPGEASPEVLVEPLRTRPQP
jgi:hypothetical protein